MIDNVSDVYKIYDDVKDRISEIESENDELKRAVIELRDCFREMSLHLQYDEDRQQSESICQKYDHIKKEH